MEGLLSGKYEVAFDGFGQLWSGMDYTKRMQDWGIEELEDIVWDEFGESDNHLVVPHYGGVQGNKSLAQVDAHKKPRHEAEKVVEKSAESREYAAKYLLHKIEAAAFGPPPKDGNSPRLEDSLSHIFKIVVPAPCDTGYVADVTALASYDTRISDDCFNNCNVDTEINKFCSENYSLGNKVSADDSKGCHFSVDDFSPADTNLCFLENEHNDRENGDLVCYDWPDIGNLERDPRMFSSEDTFISGLQSCSEYGTSECHGANMNFLSTSDPPNSDHDKCSSVGYQSYSDFLDGDAENKWKPAHVEQVTDDGGRNDINVSALTQNTFHMKKLKSQYSSEAKRKDSPSEYTNGSSFCVPGDQKLLSSTVSAPQTYSSQHVPNQKHFLGSDSLSYVHTCNPQAQLEYGIPVHQVPFTQTIFSLKPENESSPSYIVSNDLIKHAPHYMERLLDPSFEPSTMTLEQSAFISDASVQKKFYNSLNEIGGGSELQDISLGFPAVEMDSSTVQESSCLGSVFSDDITLKTRDFRQLQGVMDQLDAKTKLGIRDSLNRLARSAEKRHSVANTDNGGRENSDKRGICGTKESKKRCLKFADVETDTNPIDRSIAYLLFHTPSESATMSTDDASALESHFIDEQIRDPITKKASMPYQSVCQRVFDGRSDTMFLCNDHKIKNGSSSYSYLDNFHVHWTAACAHV